MKILLEVEDSKAKFILHLLSHFDFVSVSPGDHRSRVFMELKEAVDKYGLGKGR
ncbi:MAG: hypothetical protein V4649_10990 [Bacteroidota bacterium]